MHGRVCIASIERLKQTIHYGRRDRFAGIGNRDFKLVANDRRGDAYRPTMGLVADLAVGIVGAFIGSWLLPKLGIVLGAGLLAAIVNATIGAIILLLIIRLIQGRGRLRRR